MMRPACLSMMARQAWPPLAASALQLRPVTMRATARSRSATAAMRPVAALHCFRARVTCMPTCRAHGVWRRQRSCGADKAAGGCQRGLRARLSSSARSQSGQLWMQQPPTRCVRSRTRRSLPSSAGRRRSPMTTACQMPALAAKVARRAATEAASAAAAAVAAAETVAQRAAAVLVVAAAALALAEAFSAVAHQRRARLHCLLSLWRAREMPL